MRKITAGLFISLDGVVEDPQDWHFPYFNDEMGAAVTSQLATADTLLLGRKTYDSFAGAWPDREAAGEEDAAMGKALGDARKVVVSNQNLQFTWRNSEQLEGGFVEAVTALKNEPGATDIGMSGSVSVVRQLLAADLLDELHLLVTQSPSARGCACSTRANRPSHFALSPPRPSPPAFCTSSTPPPNRFPRAATTRRKQACPRLRTADIRNRGASSRERAGARQDNLPMAEHFRDMARQMRRLDRDPLGRLNQWAPQPRSTCPPSSSHAWESAFAH